MPFSFLSRFRIKADKMEDFLALAPQLEEISNREPWTLAYKFYRLDEPRMFAVYESFRDESGDALHQQNPESTAVIGAIIDCIDGGYTREYLHDMP